MAISPEETILAAVNTAGPVREGESDAAYQSRVAQQAIRIHLMTADTSQVRRSLDQVARAKVFPATLVRLVKEKSSTRGKATLKTKPSKWAPDGIESARTERTDNPEGLAMAKKLSELKGHRVLLWIEVQEFDGGKVRVIRHVEDLGEAREEDAAA